MKTFFGSLFVFGLAGLLECSGGHLPKESKDGQVNPKPIEQVQEKYTDSLMSLDGVVGTAVGELNGKPCIKVYVKRKTAETKKGIPKSLEGYPVVIEETGELKALDQDS